MSLEFLELMRRSLRRLEELQDRARKEGWSGYFREMDEVIAEMFEAINEQEIKLALHEDGKK